MSKYLLVQAYVSQGYTVSLLCRTLGLARSSYYAWRKSGQEKQKVLHELEDKIKKLFDKHHGRYGAPRIHQILKRTVSIGLKRVALIMRRLRLVGRRGRGRQHKNKGKLRTLRRRFPEVNLLNRKFDSKKIGEAMVADITHIGAHKLCAVMELSTREVVAYRVSKVTSAQWVSSIFEDAAERHHTKAGETILHTDQGSEFTAWTTRARVKELGLRQSFSRVGNCHDNAVIESFFGTLKTEIDLENVPHADLEDVLNTYIHYYNHERLHSKLGYKTPSEKRIELTKRGLVN